MGTWKGQQGRLLPRIQGTGGSPVQGESVKAVGCESRALDVEPEERLFHRESQGSFPGGSDS